MIDKKNPKCRWVPDENKRTENILNLYLKKIVPEIKGKYGSCILK